MHFLHVVVVIFLTLHYGILAPTGEKSMYEAITEKCPKIQSVQGYENLALFQSCRDWRAISEVNQLTATNVQKIRCLLYFEAFTSYCTSMKKLDVTIPKAFLLDNNLNVTCGFVNTIPHKNLSAIFANKENCPQVCQDDIGMVNSVCSAAYYYGFIKNDSAHKVVQVVPEAHVQQPSQEVGGEKDKNLKKHDPVGQDKPSNTAKSEDKNKQLDVKNEESKINANERPNGPDVATPSPPQSVVAPEDGSIAGDRKFDADPRQEVGQIGKSSPRIVENAPPDVGKPVAATPVNNSPNNGKPVQQTNQVEQTNQQQDDASKTKVADNTNNQDKQDLTVGDNAPDGGDEMDNVEPGNSEEENLDSLNPPPNEKASKPDQADDAEPVNVNTEMDGDSYFFTYFMILCIVFIAGYVCYHNKQKILALILEGRKGKRQYRGRRPNSANYHKLDSNLEEAINSSCKKNTTNVIY